jgi:hypothetical protein
VRGAWSVKRRAQCVERAHRSPSGKSCPQVPFGESVVLRAPRSQSRNALAPLGRERTRRLAVPPNLIERADPLKHQQPAEHSIVLRRLAALVTVG